MGTNNVQTLTIGGVTRQIEDVGARQLISSLQTALNTLTSGDTTTAIESFNEIIAFLENVSDSSTLQGIIAGLNTTIAAKYSKPSTGIPATDLAQAVQTILNSVANKANSADVYTKSEVDAAVALSQGTQGPKGDTGNVEITDAGDLVTILVNDLDTGGAGNLLSAEMGKRLALKSGTFAQAWARSKAIPFPFCFLWNETIDGDAISKPIWHKGNSVFIDATGAIVNVDAASVPAAPTITGATSGSTVPKNTQITITPASGSALYYSINGGATNVSDTAVTIKLGTAGSVSIVAYCANNKGNSSNATLSVTVAGTAVPEFTPNGGEVSRGGSVTISVPTGGELHYKVDNGSWITASGTSVNIPITSTDSEHPTVIQAYNVEDGDQSSTITREYYMAALAAPTFNHPTGTEFPIGGGSVELTGPAGATMYYTTDGSTPTDQSTLYSGAIAVSVATTIKAVAKDNYGYSEVKTASYSVAVDHKFQFKIKLTGNNSTEYVPVVAGVRYTMSVDWGDGSSVQSFDNSLIGAKNCSHQYTGSAGDEFTITLRGSSIPRLYFGSNSNCNLEALVAILDNTLECDTYFCGSNVNDSIYTAPNLVSICSNALQNNISTQCFFQGCTSLESLPDGLLSHLTKSGVALLSCQKMFYNLKVEISNSQMEELKAAISSVTLFSNMFYGLKDPSDNSRALVTIPDDFFADVADNSVTAINGLTHGAKGIRGDAEKLYNSLRLKVTSGASTSNALTGENLTNRDQVPSDWGGTAS